MISAIQPPIPNCRACVDAVHIGSYGDQSLRSFDSRPVRFSQTPNASLRTTPELKMEDSMNFDHMPDEMFPDLVAERSVSARDSITPNTEGSPFHIQAADDCAEEFSMAASDHFHMSASDQFQMSASDHFPMSGSEHSPFPMP